MDDFEKILEASEREGIRVTQGLSRLLLSMWKNASDDLRAATQAARRLRAVSILSTALAAVCLCVCVYQGTVIHRQGGEIASIHRILEDGVVVEETTTTTETTTTQTVDGDSATINNVDGEQYNDNAVNGGVE